MKKILFLKFILILCIASATCYAGNESGGYDGNPEYQLRRKIYIQQAMATCKNDYDYERLVLLAKLMATGDVNSFGVVAREGTILQNSMDRKAIANYGRDLIDYDGSSRSMAEKGVWDSMKHAIPGKVKALATILYTAGMLEKKDKIEQYDQIPTIVRLREEMKDAAPEIFGMYFDWANLDEENLGKHNDISQRWRKENLWDLPQINSKEDLSKLIKSLPANDDNKDSQAMRSIGEAVAQGKSVEDVVEQLKEEFKKEFSDKLQNLTDETKKIAQEMKEEKNKEAARITSESEQDQHRIVMGEYQGAIDTLTFFVGLKDQKAAKVIAVTGGATLKIADSIFNFLKGPGAAGKIGAFALTGDIFSAISGIMAVFQPDPAAEMHKEVMNALQTISQQIEDLRTEIIGKLDGIEENTVKIIEDLAKISKALSENKIEARSWFEELNNRLNVIEKLLVDSTSHNKNVNNDLSEFNRLADRAFEDVSDIYTLKLDSKTFADYRHTFRYHATNIARDLNGDNFGSSSNISYLLWHLNQKPLNHQYLYNYLHLATEKVYSTTEELLKAINADYQKSTTPNAGGTISNPLEWARGAQAFSTLYLLQPEYKINKKNLEDIIKFGEAIQSTIREWRDTKNGLLDKIYSEYKRVLDQIYIEADTSAKTKFDERFNGSSGYFETWKSNFNLVTDDGVELFLPPDSELQRVLALAGDRIKLKGFWRVVDINEVEKGTTTKYVPGKPWKGEGAGEGVDIEINKYRYSYKIECGWSLRTTGPLGEYLGHIGFKVVVPNALPATDWLSSTNDVENYVKGRWKDPQTGLRGTFVANMRREDRDGREGHQSYDMEIIHLIHSGYEAYVARDKMKYMSTVLDLFNNKGNNLYELKERLSELWLLLDSYLRLGFSVDGSNNGSLALLLPMADDVVWTISRSSHIEDWRKESSSWDKQFNEKFTELLKKYEDPSLPTIPGVDDLLLLLKSPLIQMRVEEKAK